jgi:hypothetical protein
MGHLSEKLRERDIQELTELVVPRLGQVANWLVQGLPGCGVEEVFAGLVENLQTEVAGSQNVSLIELDLSSYWTGPISQCVEAMLALMPALAEPTASTDAEEDQTFSVLLSKLRETVSTLAESGWRFIFVFEHFDAVLKFLESDQVQHLLNTFQSLCYNPRYHTVNIIQCFRDIDDICQATNCSDYYKIFGSNYYRVANVPGKTLEKMLRDADPGLNAPIIHQIVELSAGYPEHAEVLLRFAGDVGDNISIDQLALDAPGLTFHEWENCLTTEETAVLLAIRGEQSLGLEHSAGRRKLQRKGIVVEKNGKFRIASPLFELFLSDRRGKVDEKQTVFVRQVGNLSDVHRKMLEQLFHGHYYIEWKLLQAPLPGNATVYLVTGEDRNGTPYRPCIVKIDNAQRSASEIKNLEEARAMLGSLVPNLLKQHSLGGQEAVILEYATGDNKGYSVQQFADFYQERSAEEIDDLLNRVLGQALYPFYRKQMCKQEVARRLYFLPRLHQGEYDQIAELAKRSSFYQSSDDTLRLPGIDTPLSNPGIYLRPPPESAAPDSPYGRFFLLKRPVGLCFTHGDLNPRNFLIDGIGNVHLIDFCEMRRDGARFMDFVRLEAEVKFKLTEVTPASLESMLALESLLVEASTEKQLERLKQLPLGVLARKMVYAVAALRQIARSICEEAIDDLQFDAEYKLGLLAQTMRISLFQDYLNEPQREFAVLSSALLVHRLDNLFSTNHV